MTHFKVSDEAAQAGLKALNDQYGNRDNSPEDLIRLIIEAVLPVMFQPTYQIWLRSSGVWEDLDESVYLTLSEDNDEGAMKFRVSYVPKESK